jgi:AcrR family transcriptional regulator
MTARANQLVGLVWYARRVPALPTSTRGAATSRRILSAAAAEFARYGIAGARIERIIATARTNKAQLYSYFGSKDDLFDAVVADRLTDSLEDAAFDADDLAGWAVALYDHNVTHPDLSRLIAWARLERRPAGLWFGDSTQFQPKVEAIRQAQARGLVRDADPVDLLGLVIATAGAWSPASPVFTATANDPREEHDRRRTLLHDYVQHAIAPSPHPDTRTP